MPSTPPVVYTPPSAGSPPDAPPAVFAAADAGVATAIIASGSTSPTSSNGVFDRIDATSYKSNSGAVGIFWVTGGTSYWSARDSNSGTERWRSPDAGDTVAVPDPITPDLVETWTAVNGSTGTYAVARSLKRPPVITS